MSGKKPIRLAILSSHPIQYQAPLFRRLAADPELDVLVLFCSAPGAYWDDGFKQKVEWDVPLLDGYRWRVLPNRSPWPNQSTFTGVINPAIIDEVRRHAYDAILLHGWGNITSLVAACAAIRSRLPIFLRAETSVLGQPSGLKGYVKRALLKRAFRHVSGFLATGTHSAAFYTACGVPAERVMVAPYAVDNDFFVARLDQRALERRLVREQFRIPQSAPMLLSVGKLIPRKRPEDILRAFARVGPKYRAALVFAGDGELKPRLEAIVRTEGIANVTIAGFQNQSALTSFYAAADVFAIASSFETWGLVVNEAMCCGLPIVASDGVGATGDLVEHGANGFIYPAGDVAALAAYLDRLFADPALQERCGERSFSLVQTWSYAEGVEVIKAALRHAAAVSPRAVRQ